MSKTVRYGDQNPTFEVTGDWYYTEGPVIIDYFKEFGFNFYPYQEHIMNMYGSRLEDDSFAATSIGNCMPRRNGKSFSARLYAAYLVMSEGCRVLYSAHHGATVTEMFKELCKLFDDPIGYPEFNEQIDYVYKQPGKEGIYLLNGGCIEFNTRTNNNARGSGYKIVIIDEAQEFTDAQADSLLPTISAAAASNGMVVEDPQVIYIGTPNYPECHGTVFARMHKDAHSGNESDLWWSEFGITELPNEDITEKEKEDLMYRTNPGLGYRISVKALVANSVRMSWDGYCREILGWWMPDTGGYEHMVEKDIWDKCATTNPPNPENGKVAYGVKFSPDATRAAVCIALKTKDNPIHIELVKVGDLTHGSKWLIDMLSSMYNDITCYLADGRGSADNLYTTLRGMHCPKLYCRTAATRDVIQAESNLVDMIRQGAITHYNQPELTNSIVGASKRKIGSSINPAYGFGDAPDIDSTPAEAAALAVLAVTTTKRDPHRSQKVVSF